MIISKSNLKVADVAKIDSSIPALGNVHFLKDGSTVAANGRALITVSPVHKEVKQAIPLTESVPKEQTISLGTVKEILKNMPKDVMFKGLLEHCDLGIGTFTLHDGKRKKKVEAKVYDREYIDFRKMFYKAGEKRSKCRIVLNRKRLINLLQAIDAICTDNSGENPIYLDFTEDNNIILRGVNVVNGQRAIAVMTSYKHEEGKWLVEDVWEEKMLGKRKAKTRRKSVG